MLDILRPTDFEARILAGEAPGGPPARVAVYPDSIVAPGEPFGCTVAVQDENELPSLACDGTVHLSAPGVEPGAIAIPFEAGRPAVARVEKIRTTVEGFHRLEGSLDGMQVTSHPFRCMANPPHRLYWGDPHVHTVVSDCHAVRCRSLFFCFTAARRLAGLDWATAADHVSNGRSELARWKESVAASEAYNDPPHFVTLPGYEASLQGGAGGDNNVYLAEWPDLFVDAFEEGNTRTLADQLAEKAGEGAFFLVPHHTTRTNKHGEIGEDIDPGPERMPLIEIHSKWGTSEYRGNPNPLEKIHPGPSYAVDLLESGMPLGFIGGTDAHNTLPATRGTDGHLTRPPGMTAVRAQALTRRNIFEALRTRQCYAASTDRILLDGDVDGEPFGRILPADPDRRAAPRRIRYAAAARTDIARLELVRNGETLAAHEGADWRMEGEFVDSDALEPLALEGRTLGHFVFYYLRLTCGNGAQAWLGPVWFVW